jgi:hypothetical protein
MRRRRRKDDAPKILAVLADTCRILGVVIIVIIHWLRDG